MIYRAWQIFLLVLGLSGLLYGAEGIKDVNQSVTLEDNKSVSLSWWDNNVEFDYEIDPYYSNISWTFSLTDSEVENAVDKSEIEIYYDLLMKSLPPRFIVVELSVNPLPVLGVYLKKNKRESYDNSLIFGDLNWIEAVTVGFQEPYALSFFLGNTVKFTEPGEEVAAGNRAYAGFLVSLADSHIKENILIEDASAEIEWKVIGFRKLEDQKLSWSYRIGTRLHEHPEITDTIYIGFRRSRLDFESSPLSILNNAAFEYKSTFSIKTLASIGHEVYYEKKFPVTLWGHRYGLNFGVGYFYQGDQKYSGALKQQGIQTHNLILRPNLDF